jgi:hypothetical protein
MSPETRADIQRYAPPDPKSRKSMMDQIERLRHGLKMCILHAEQPDKEQACQIVIRQAQSCLDISEIFDEPGKPQPGDERFT